MCLQSPPELTSAFVPFPAEVLSHPFQIDWLQTAELYRIALEHAQAVQRPSIADRLAPYWN